MNGMVYCTNCVYPRLAVNLVIDDDGKCSACHSHEQFNKLSSEYWAKRRKMFVELIKSISKGNGSNYDCIVPVSGGKDSYYQTHVMVKEMGFKPLLVTYHGNNYLPEGDYNRDRMRHVFDCDHLVMGPSVEVLRKLNRLGFKKMGDMNWHAHCGITTYPIQVAVKFNVPLIIWGETAWDISGMFDIEDFVEFSARTRHEHSLRGFEWNDMVNDEEDLLTEKDLSWMKYPTDAEILNVGVRGLYIGNFLKWDPIKHTELITRLYGWRSATRPFERTYRTASNLDDRYENGVHDFLKFIKFGYGRASDHASKDIRMGYMSRETGIEMVRKHDAVVPSDLEHWLNYVGYSEENFWRIADRFRDPRVWWIENGKWWKQNLWGTPSSYGRVWLSAGEQVKYLLKNKTSERNVGAENECL